MDFSYEVSSYSGQSVLSDWFDCEHVKLKKFFDVIFRQKNGLKVGFFSKVRLGPICMNSAPNKLKSLFL